MGPRGVSMDEKCKRMLDLFHERGEPFQMKELERRAPKEKGITANSVKDVIEKLLDKELITTGKIGVSTYFWSFPRAAKNKRKRKLEELHTNYEETNKKIKILKESAKEDTEKHSERKQVLSLKENITDLQINKDELAKQLQKFKNNDPNIIKELTLNIQNVKNAANRWTDNVFQIKTWCRNKFYMEDAAMNKQFDIKANFDYIE